MQTQQSNLRDVDNINEFMCWTKCCRIIHKFEELSQDVIISTGEVRLCNIIFVGLLKYAIRVSLTTQAEISLTNDTVSMYLFCATIFYSIHKASISHTTKFISDATKTEEIGFDPQISTLFNVFLD